MNWNLLVVKSARKELARLPSCDQQRIEAALDEIAANPFSGDIKRLPGSQVQFDIHMQRVYLAAIARYL